uniref:Protein lethal enticleless n=1 Tax=Sipha flava TaxID=143950 RepID=A0A2S2QAU7_9HEMI
MDPNNVILYYLNRRQLGYEGIRNNVKEIVIDQMGHKYSSKGHNISIGNTFACKFSRNKNNLHLLGCSTEHGEIIIQPTLTDNQIVQGPITRNAVHNNAIFNFAWAEPEMKIVTACGDQTSKLFSVTPSGNLVEIKVFPHNSSVKSVMFCPGSSNVFCGGAIDGSIKVWDARMNHNPNALEFDRKIPNSHAIYGLKKRKPIKVFGISALLFMNEQTVISSSLLDGIIKVWDLRKSYRNVKIFGEPLPRMRYYHKQKPKTIFVGFMDMITNPQLTRLYASGVNNMVYSYALDSTESNALCQYSGYSYETNYSKISISNDGRYLFSGCNYNSGVIWNTDFPHTEKPVINMITKDPIKKELSSSDWCADPACMKLATSSDSLPNIWTIHPSVENNENMETKIIRTASHKYKFPPRVYTAPIKLDALLKEKYEKETEEDMENWDTMTQNNVQNVCNLPVTPKKPWKVMFSKKTSPQRKTKSKQSSPVTPTSNRKRKKSSVSPKNLIDHYFPLNNKRKN